MAKTKSLVVNWHITEACNFSCKYCYAHWAKSCSKRDVFRDHNKSKVIINQIYDFFKRERMINPLFEKIVWEDVRVNIAGGEPLLYKEDVQRILDIIESSGLKASIITNGSLLDENFIIENAKKIEVLGVSIDSDSPEINREIGRQCNKKKQIDLGRISGLCKLARSINPNIEIKLNTVVSRFNFSENLSDIVGRIAPDRWKIMRMLPSINSNGEISGNQFRSFVARHNSLSHLIQAEDNADMRCSYLMIDPLGRFYQNSNLQGKEYVYSNFIAEVGIAEAFSEIFFDHESFSSRYNR